MNKPNMGEKEVATEFSSKIKTSVPFQGEFG